METGRNMARPATGGAAVHPLALGSGVELDLLEHLHDHSIGVPLPVPSDDGRRHVGDVLIQQFIDGRPPRDGTDWRRVVEVLTAVHELTVGWPHGRGGVLIAFSLR